MLTMDGEQAFFFKNTPLAPTLHKNDWVEFKRGAVRDVDIPVLPSAGLRVLPPAKLRLSLAESETQLAGTFSLLCRAVPKLAMDTTDLDFKAAVEDSYASLKSARSAFRLIGPGEGALPDDLVIELLPPSLQVLARAFVEG
jgi:hypothetical protein